eukprot:Gb_30422 [translate_table: standard]
MKVSFALHDRPQSFFLIPPIPLICSFHVKKVLLEKNVNSAAYMESLKSYLLGFGYTPDRIKKGKQRRCLLVSSRNPGASRRVTVDQESSRYQRGTISWEICPSWPSQDVLPDKKSTITL